VVLKATMAMDENINMKKNQH